MDSLYAGVVQRVRVRFSIALLLALLFVSVPAFAADAPERIIDVVQVSWPGAPSSGNTAEQLATVIRTDTIDRWRRISNGQVQFTSGQTLPSLAVTSQLPCDGYASLLYMTSIRATVYERAGIGDSSHRFLIILTPRPTPDCVWDGRGITNSVPSTSGTIVLKDTIDSYVVAHELGHNLGLGHSNLERCSNGRRDDVWANCKAIEYGSATDLMSNNDRDSTLAAYHLWRLGIIPDTDVVQPSGNRTVTLRPVTDASGPRAIFVRDTAAAYWIEFRQADPKNQIGQGLVIYRTDPPPGTSVQSPISSDASDPANSNVTLDVWMINLGDYTYLPPNSSGSPSLPLGTTFTTAYGGATISAAVNADGSATVQIKRSADLVAPSAPTLTAQSSWRTPTSELIDAAYLDREGAIQRFEARLTDASGERIVTVPSTTISNWTPTYLHPISAPSNVRLSALPEGRYTLALRAVDEAGNLGAWSQGVSVTVDRGRPTIVDVATTTTRLADAGRRTTVRWTGAKDSGSGICSARTVNDDGFAELRWTRDTPGVPDFALDATTTVQSPAQVFDCLGNGVTGTLNLRTQFTKSTDMRLTGNWKRASTQSVCTTTCTAEFTTDPGSTTVLVRQGSATVSVDGKVVTRVAKKTATALRVAYRVDGQHKVRITGRQLALVGAQTVAVAWNATGEIDRVPIDKDPSLEDTTQQELARFGFRQEDFSDLKSVLPMTNGTTLNDPSLDWCNGTFTSEKQRAARRQVSVRNATGDQPYLFLSSETVRYSSEDAVRTALAELDTADRNCRTNGGGKGTDGVFTPYTYLPAPTLPAGLRPGSDSRIYRANSGSGDSQISMLVVYQFKGDLMNNLYVIKRGANALTQDEVTRWLKVAATLASRM